MRERRPPGSPQRETAARCSAAQACAGRRRFCWRLVFGLELPFRRPHAETIGNGFLDGANRLTRKQA